MTVPTVDIRINAAHAVIILFMRKSRVLIAVQNEKMPSSGTQKVKALPHVNRVQTGKTSWWDFLIFAFRQHCTTIEADY